MSTFEGYLEEFNTSKLLCQKLKADVKLYRSDLQACGKYLASILMSLNGKHLSSLVEYMSNTNVNRKIRKSFPYKESKQLRTLLKIVLQKLNGYKQIMHTVIRKGRFLTNNSQTYDTIKNGQFFEILHMNEFMSDIFFDNNLETLMKRFLVKSFNSNHESFNSNTNNNSSNEAMSKSNTDKHVKMDDENLDRLQSDSLLLKEKRSASNTQKSGVTHFCNKHVRNKKVCTKKKSVEDNSTEIKKQKAFKEKRFFRYSTIEYDSEGKVIKRPFCAKSDNVKTDDNLMNKSEKNKDDTISEDHDSSVMKLNCHPLGDDNNTRKETAGVATDGNKKKSGICKSAKTEKNKKGNDAKRNDRRSDEKGGNQSLKADSKSKRNMSYDQYKDSEDDTYIGLTSTFKDNDKNGKRQPVTVKTINDVNENFEIDNKQLKDEVASAEAARDREDERISALRRGQMNEKTLLDRENEFKIREIKPKYAKIQGDKQKDKSDNFKRGDPEEHLEQIRKMKEIEINRLKALEERRKKCKSICEERARKKELARLLEKEKRQQEASEHISTKHPSAKNKNGGKENENSVINGIDNRKSDNRIMMKGNSNNVRSENVSLPRFLNQNKNHSLKALRTMSGSKSTDTTHGDPILDSSDKLESINHNKVSSEKNEKNQSKVFNESDQLIEHFFQNIHIDNDPKMLDQKLKRDKHLKVLEEERKLLKAKYFEDSRQRETLRLLKRSECQLNMQQDKPNTKIIDLSINSNLSSFEKINQSRNYKSKLQGIYTINGTDYDFASRISSISRITNKRIVTQTNYKDIKNNKSRTGNTKLKLRNLDDISVISSNEILSKLQSKQAIKPSECKSPSKNAISNLYREIKNLQTKGDFSI